METNLIMRWLEDMYPNTLPLDKVSEYELGVLIGQRTLIEHLKIKLNIERPTEEITK